MKKYQNYTALKIPMINPRNNIQKLNRMKDFGSDRSSFKRFDKNERTVPFPENIYKEMLKTISNDSLPVYPDQNPLYIKLSNFLNIEKESLLLTAGSDSAIKTIYETYISSGEKVIYLWPTYAMIDVYADMFEAQKIKINFSSKLDLNFKAFLNKIDENIRAVFIANPNQPTGTILSQLQIKKLISKTNEVNSLLIFDEAYLAFSKEKSALQYIDKYSNVIVTKTFSKACGLASIRLGYIISNPNNINCLYKVKPYADINYFALKIGEYLLDNYWIVNDYVKEINKSKILLESVLSDKCVNIIKGHTNFVHLKFPKGYDLDLISKNMREKGYLIRTTGSGMPAVLKDCIRITVGPRSQMEPFLVELKRFI